MTKDRRIRRTVLLTQEQDAKLGALADKTGIPASEYVRQAVERLLAEQDRIEREAGGMGTVPSSVDGNGDEHGLRRGALPELHHALEVQRAARAGGGVVVMFPKPEGRKRDREYLGEVHELGCILADTKDAGHCWGKLEANHVGERPVGRKSDDDETVPVCSRHHSMWTTHWGFFDGWNREERRRWAREAVERTRALVALRRTGLHVVAVPW